MAEKATSKKNGKKRSGYAILSCQDHDILVHYMCVIFVRDSLVRLTDQLEYTAPTIFRFEGVC